MQLPSSDYGERGSTSSKDGWNRTQTSRNESSKRERTGGVGESQSRAQKGARKGAWTRKRKRKGEGEELT